jgi:hypothetical protein
MITLELPEAPPKAYLRWMAYWREVERWMLEHRDLEAAAEVESAPFFHNRVAEFLSREAIPQIVRQAQTARRQGRRVAPKVEAPPDIMAEAVGYIIRRSRWLQEQELAGLPGMPPLDEEVANIRAKVMAVIQLQLAGRPREGGSRHIA